MVFPTTLETLSMNWAIILESTLVDQVALLLVVIQLATVLAPIGMAVRVASAQDLRQSIAITRGIMDLSVLLSFVCLKGSTMSFVLAEKFIRIAEPLVRACSLTKEKFAFRVYGSLSGVLSAWRLASSP